MVFQPEIENDVTVAYVHMPEGTPTEITAAAVEQIANAARAVADEEDARSAADGSLSSAADGSPSESVFLHFSTSVGRQPYRIRQASGPSSFASAGARGSHLGEVQIEVVDAEHRNVSVFELTRRWRERAGEIVGAEEVTFTASLIAVCVDFSLRSGLRTLKRLL